MPNKSMGGLDRRDFMVSSLAAAGASAALVATATIADAQDAATTAAGTATPRASQGTVYTGDVIQGRKVISAMTETYQC